jgi:hypothetical protein
MPAPIKTPPPPAAASSANQWNGSSPPATTQAGPTTPSGITPPAVPTTGGGSGTVSVNTDLLSTVANNLDTLNSSVDSAFSKLSGLTPLAPGAFWDAYQLKAAVGSPGDGSTSDLVNSYMAVLTDLGAGLKDIQNALQQMKSTYTTFDQLNQMKVSDLDTDLNSAESNFTTMMTANGGSSGTSSTTGNTPPPTTGNTPPPKTGSGTGSTNSKTPTT